MKLPNRGRRNRLLPGAMAWAVVLVAAGAALGQGWWQPKWTYRREVTLGAQRPSGQPGSDIAVVTMPTGGLIKPDGSDVRVATVGRTEVPCRVLMVGPGDQVRLAFAIRRNTTRYYVYFGHPRPPASKLALEIRRGVLQETWVYPGGGIKTLQQVQAVFSRAKRLLGRDFRDRVFLGHNPFGPQNSIASRFTAYLPCSAAGQYKFACSSQDASFLLIDGKVVVANGGHHSPQRDISKQGAVTLSKGLHKLTFYHVNVTGHPIAVAAWQPPGGKRIWPIDAKAFAPVVRAKPGAMAQYGKSQGVDFLPRYGGECFLRNRYYQRWTFEALTPGRAGRRMDLTWDFGDGQKASSPKVEHVYLVPGEHTVTLTARGSRGGPARKNRIFVTRPWDQVATNRLDAVTQHARIIKDYNFASLSAEANAHAILLLERARASDLLKRAGLAFIARGEASAALVELVVPLFAEAMAPRERIDALLKGAKMTRNIAVRAQLTQLAGRTALDDLADTDGAMKLFELVVRQYGPLTSSRAVREAKVGMGDVWRVRGDRKKAAEAYRSAGLGKDVNPARLEIIKGDYARHVEDYLLKGDFTSAMEYVRRWETDIPQDKLEGYWTLLVVRMHLKQRKYADAAREAMVLVKANPTSNYAAQLLLHAAEAYGKLNKDAEAKAALKRIVEKYPESPLVGQAATQLRK